MRWIIHIDFNSFFATVEQQANPRLRGKPIGVTGGDRTSRTVVGAASVEAKKRGVTTGMKIPDALKICPDLILVKGDSDKYLSINKKFLNILKGYSDKLEVFSIDEVFLEIDLRNYSERLRKQRTGDSENLTSGRSDSSGNPSPSESFWLLKIASDIKDKIRNQAGDWITVSIGISYNKMLAKLAGSRYKPDGLMAIMDRDSAIWVLDRVELDDICGLGPRTKRHLNNMGVFNFKDLRKIPLQNLLSAFKSYGKILYDFARGEDPCPVIPFYEKEEVKSIGHQYTISRDIDNPQEIKQTLLKICELVARRARSKRLEGKTISFWFRYGFNLEYFKLTGDQFRSNGMQTTILYSNDGFDIFKAAWDIFLKLWDGTPIRFLSVSLSNLVHESKQTISLLDEVKKREVITRALDAVNNRYGEFTLQRATLLNSRKIRRMANSFMSDRRFELGKITLNNSPSLRGA